MRNLLQTISKLQKQGKKAALCIVIHTKGSTPQKAGAKMLVATDGSIQGSVGGGGLEHQVIDDAMDVIAKGKPRIFTHTLLADHEMCCGGSVEVYIEPIMTQYPLYIFGAGHIGRALAEVAATVDFLVTVIDEREERFADWAQDEMAFIPQNHRKALGELNFDQDAFIAVVTHDHAYDREIIAHCINQPFAYLGMIGSVRKVEIAKKKLTASGVPSERLDIIDWPMGLEIEAQTPAEIAVSIIAKMIKLRAEKRKHGST